MRVGKESHLQWSFDSTIHHGNTLNEKQNFYLNPVKRGILIFLTFGDPLATKHRGSIQVYVTVHWDAKL